MRGSGRGKGVLEDTFSGLCQIRPEPLQAPTPGPLISQKEPDPENLEKTAVFQSLSDSYFSAPLPLAPLFVKNLKKVVRKGDQLYRLLRFKLRTSKTGLRVTFWEEFWPILWHIWCFPLCGNSRKRGQKAIRKLQRIFWRCP